MKTAWYRLSDDIHHACFATSAAAVIVLAAACIDTSVPALQAVNDGLGPVAQKGIELPAPGVWSLGGRWAAVGPSLLNFDPCMREIGE